jgi:hypothetical protein
MCEPNVLDLTAGLEKAIQLVRTNQISQDTPKLICDTWDQSFQASVEFLKSKLDMEKYKSY